MRAALMICAVVLILTGLRLLNVYEDVVTATFIAFLAILCIWGSLTIDKVRENDRIE